MLALTELIHYWQGSEMEKCRVVW